MIFMGLLEHCFRDHNAKKISGPKYLDPKTAIIKLGLRLFCFKTKTIMVAKILSYGHMLGGLKGD